MRDPLTLTTVAYTRAPDRLRASGLRGFVRIVVNNGLVIDGVQVRETLDARLILSWPERKGSNSRHRIVHPADGGARAHLERQILDALRQMRDLP